MILERHFKDECCSLLQANAIAAVRNAQVHSGVKLPQVYSLQIKMKDESNRPKLIKEVLKLEVGHVSSPIAINGKYWIVTLSSKKGITTLPYNYAKGEIKQIVYV